MSFDVGVVGAGMAGLATAWKLAEAGARVVVAERRSIGHDGGSSHGATRIFRLVYEDPLYSTLALRARPMWDDLQPGLLETTGGVDIGSGHHLDRVAAALAECGASFDRLAEGDEQLADAGWLIDGRERLLSPDTAVIDAEAALRAMAARAASAGADLREGCALDSVAEEDGSVRITTAGGETIRATSLVVAAGAWTPSLLAPLGIELPARITREEVFFFDGALPQVLIDWDELVYAVPPHSPGGPVKVAEHMRGTQADPDEPRVHTGSGSRRRVAAYVARHLPTLDPQPARGDTCLYTTTPDHDFVLDRVGRVVVCSPCSGHGFKFAPVVGEIVAALALDEPAPVDIERFRIARFGEASPGDEKDGHE